ncbi:glycosyltransferase family 2 protein [Thauera sp. AutoDN2]|uniref:glycosyltransferase family 2 protein n=1 Tax=Thauera sp. AutoDN2 TaxID=3416051 RepID=UPI003F4BFFE7
MSPPPLLVSILIRSTDRVELDEALRSVALQTWPAIEVLVIDALGAGHRALEPKCGRFPLRLESAGRHLARSAAANLGLERAHGEFLLLLDDDDWLEPEHIGRLVERLQAEPEAIAAYAGVDCVRVREDGRTETVRTYNEPYDPARLMVENTIPIHALLFRKRAVEAGCRFDEAFDLYEDWDFWLQIANLGTFSHVDAISARYRIHGESGLGVAAEETRSIEALRQLLAKWGPRWSPAQLQQLVARSRLLAQLLTQANRHDEAQQQQILVQTQRMEAQQQQILVQTQRMEALQHDISGAQRDAEDWRQRFEWVTASLSWRLTAPLRSGKSAARVAVRQARSAAWRAALWTYRQDALRPLIAAVPFGVKQRLRGFLRHEEPIPAEPLSTTPSELLVSIVIPVYNHADYIEDCITSALVQTYPHVEVVVVDDASPDARVREILHRLEGHPRLKVIYNENNLGISRTQNRALVASRGQLIGFLDCDDHLTPDAVERCVAAWNPGIVYLHTGRINMDAEGKEINRISFEHLPRHDYFAENLERMYATHFKVIRRDAFTKVGLFDPRFDSAQDYDMLMRIAFHYPSSAFLHLPAFVYHHRIHDRQATERMNTHQQWSTETIQNEARTRQDIRNGHFDKFLSIIMLSFGKQRQTLEALQSLQETVRVPHEIILFDNGSDPETVDFIKTRIEGRFPGLRVFYNDTNLGPAAGRREALKLAKGDWFIVFDNDEIAEPGWLEELLVRARALPDVGAVCCRVVFPNRRLQFSGGYIAPIDEELIDLKLHDQEASIDDLATAEFREIDWSPIGATLFLENPVRHLHGGYPNVFEDAGVSMALRREGKRLLNSPGSWVWHEHYMFRKEVDMKERYLQSRYDPRKMLISVASFYRENGKIIRDEYIWRENGLDALSREQLKSLLEKQPLSA